MRSSLRLWLLCLLIVPVLARAQSAYVEPDRRLVRIFDFEDVDDQGRLIGLGGGMPEHWYPVGRELLEGDPVFLEQPIHREIERRSDYSDHAIIEFSQQHATSGKFSLKLNIDGSHTGVFIETGVLAVVPHSDYAVTANVRTEKLRGAGARLRAYFVDEHGRMIQDSLSFSGPPVRTGGQWRQLSVRIPGRFEDAAWMMIEAEVVQPQPHAEHPLGSQQVVLKDVEGMAWVDDVAVWKLPHVEVSTQSPLGVVRSPAQPEFRVEVRDLTNRRMQAKLTIYDHMYEPVATLTRGVGAGEPASWVWTPDLPRYGWYVADLQVSEPAAFVSTDGLPQDRLVARSLGATLWLGPQAVVPYAERSRFTLWADRIEDEHLPLIGPLVNVTGLKSVAASAWHKDLTVEGIDDWLAKLEQHLIKPLRDSDGELTLSLNPVPQRLADAEGMNEPSPLDVLALPPKNWMPFAQPLLMRHGQRVRLWQLGNPNQTAIMRGDLADIVLRVQGQINAMVPAPTTIVPWSLDQPRPTFENDAMAYALAWPQGVKPAALADQLAPWLDPPAKLRLHLDIPPADKVDHGGRVADLMLRALHAWELDAGGLVLNQPWTRAKQRESAILPDPLLGVFATLMEQLSGRRVVGRMYLGQGLECMVLDGPAGGALAAWSVDSQDATPEAKIWLGLDPAVIDAFGNMTAPSLREGVHHVDLSPTPVIVTGIDPQLALLRASFKLDRPFIESTQETHERVLTFKNPWNRTISGTMRIEKPEGWTIEPRFQNFSLPAGGTMKVPLRIRFPFSEVGGHHELQARFEFQGDRAYDVILATPMEIGLEDVDFQATASIERNPQTGQTDVVTTCVITNSGSKARSLFVFASLRGFTRQEQVVSRLQPGESVVRRLRFPGGGPTLLQHPVRCGLREMNGPAVLNRMVDLSGG